MFFQFNTDVCKGPQCLLMPFGDTFNCFETHLSKLELFDDLPVHEWIRKAQNSEKEFAPKPGDDQNEQNRLESMQRWFSDGRFSMEKKYFTRDSSTVHDVSQLQKFIDGAMAGKGQLHFDSATLPTEYAHLKVLCG